jgi:uncharacterized protein (UPF0333 family)
MKNKIRNLKKNKAQISLEVIVVILLLIVFVHIYTYMSEDTYNSLEISQIKKEQKNIALNLDLFLQEQKGVLAPANNNYDIDCDYQIGTIKVPSTKVNCTIDLNSTNIRIYSPKYDGIITNYHTNLSSNHFTLPKRFYCGQNINCIDSGNRIDCS